jgi:RNA polymerase sigma-70 factor (ECF subfamily)
MSGTDVPDLATLRAWAATAIDAGRAAWPQLSVSEEELAHLAGLRLAAQPGDADPVTALSRLDPAELYLASACARGDASALTSFRVRYFEPVTPALRRMGLGDAQRDDVWQLLCERLLVGDVTDPARIARYAGAGELAGLVRVAATRLALNWLEQERRRSGSSEEWLGALQDGRSDPELHAMKQQHQDELKQELEAAIARLSARDRMLLRLHLVEHLGIDPIAAICGVHRATAARWIAQAKGDLTARVRAQLQARWRLADESLPALATAIDSQLDLSLERLLAGD